jgi:rhamnosyl/mannosyltransferase
MRILMIASELPPVQSGVARAAGRLAEGFASRGHEVRFLSSADAWSRHFGEFRVSGLGRRWLRLERTVADADLVYLTGPAPFIADALLLRWGAARPPVPLVYTHGFTVELGRARAVSALYGALHHRLVRVADAVVATTPTYGRLLERFAPGRVHVIPWGLDAPAFVPSTAGAYDGRRPLRVLFVGQQRPYKGIPVLIEAAAGLPSLTVTIAGAGPHQRRYEELSDRLGARNIVHCGHIDEDTLRDAYGSHDVVVLPSTNRSEAFGLVLLEGMAAGCVPVASRLPGVADVVGDAGKTAPPGDVAALRATLTALAAAPAEVERLRARATARARTYDWEASIEAYCSVFTGVARSRAEVLAS